MVDGDRLLFFGGSVHYPRAPRSEWSTIMQEAKASGLNIIQTYVFWDVHEPEKDVFHFPSDSKSNENLVAFVQEAAKAGLFVHLRIAGYVCAEWNYGGLPVWLREMKNSTFRTFDERWLIQLQDFIEKTIDVVKSAKLLAADGGPIVMLQIENEYGNMEQYYGWKGKKYVQWLSEYALSLYEEVGNIPWVMCQQGEGVGTAPSAQIVNACNGYYCDDWIASHAVRFPNQPHMFTENWPGWFQKWGEPAPHRPATDVAFSVARWIAKGGTYMNYYMAFGGTSFGRHVGGPSIITSYDYDVQINEYAQRAEPKFSLLQRLHSIIKEYSAVLLDQMPPNAEPLEGSTECETHFYGNTTSFENMFIVFLSNWGSSLSCTFHVAHQDFEVPPWSVSILQGKPDSSVSVFNTKTYVNEITPNIRKFTPIDSTKLDLIGSKRELIPTTCSDVHHISSSRCILAPQPLEQLSVTKDSSDYLWYSTSIPFKALSPMEDGTYSVTVSFTSGGAGGEVFYAFIDSSMVANTIERHRARRRNSIYDPREDNVLIKLEILLPQADNYPEYIPLSILSVSMGLQNYEPFLEKASVGIVSVVSANGFQLENFTHIVGMIVHAFSAIRRLQLLILM